MSQMNGNSITPDDPIVCAKRLAGAAKWRAIGLAGHREKKDAAIAACVERCKPGGKWQRNYDVDVDLRKIGEEIYYSTWLNHMRAAGYTGPARPINMDSSLEQEYIASLRASWHARWGEGYD